VSPTITQNPTTKAVTVMFNAPVAWHLHHLDQVRFEKRGGRHGSQPDNVHYDFATTGVPGSTSDLI